MVHRHCCDCQTHATSLSGLGLIASASTSASLFPGPVNIPGLGIRTLRYRRLNTDQLERQLVLTGCVGKCAKNGDRVVSLNQHRQPLVQEYFLAVVISDLSDAPSLYVEVCVGGTTGSASDQQSEGCGFEAY